MGSQSRGDRGAARGRTGRLGRALSRRAEHATRGRIIGSVEVGVVEGEWSAGRGATVLLATEEGTSAAALREALERAGYRVVVATDPRAAVAISRGLAVEVLLRVGSPAFRAGFELADDESVPMVDDDGGPQAPARVADSVRLGLCLARFIAEPPDAQA